jgi:hypothetical protein
LADDFVEGCGTHPGCERRHGRRCLASGLLEQVTGHRAEPMPPTSRRVSAKSSTGQICNGMTSETTRAGAASSARRRSVVMPAAIPISSAPVIGAQ